MENLETKNKKKETSYNSIINNKKIEVLDILKKASKLSEQRFIDLFNEITERIKNPIFQTEKSIIASAIFAKGFGKVLCTHNIKYVGQLVDNIGGELKDIGNKIANEFNEDQIWNKSIHQELLKIADRIKSGKQTKESEIALFLMEQIIGEIATDTITKLNNPKSDKLQSHYFDFIQSMEQETPEELAIYQKSGDIESQYVEGLENLLNEGGNDALIAVSVMSEAFIGLTYETILDTITNMKNDKHLYKTLINFYEGHISLDGVEEIGATDTHFYMVCQMLPQVENRDNFILYAKEFIQLRNIVHNECIKTTK